MKSLLNLFAIAVLMISCNTSPDGRYQITAFKAGDNGDSKITEVLKKAMLNREYDIVFDSLMATTHSLTTHEDLVLKRLHSAIPAYMGEFQKKGVSYQLLIRREQPLLMRVTATLPTEPPMADSLMSNGQMSKNQSYTPWASIDCYLTKVDK